MLVVTKAFCQTAYIHFMLHQNMGDNQMILIEKLEKKVAE
jgi:hypothetical protein